LLFFKVTIFRRQVLPICCIAGKNTSKALNYLQNVWLMRLVEAGGRIGEDGLIFVVAQKVAVPARP